MAARNTAALAAIHVTVLRFTRIATGRTTAAATRTRLIDDTLPVRRTIGMIPFDKVVDQHRPSALGIVVGHAVVDVGGKVEQQVPGVLRDGSLVVLLFWLRRTMRGG